MRKFHTMAIYVTLVTTHVKIALALVQMLVQVVEIIPFYKITHVLIYVMSSLKEKSMDSQMIIMIT